MTALMWAAQMDHTEFCQILLKVEGILVNQQENNYLRTALMFCAHSNNVEVGKILVLKGAETEVLDSDSMGALQWAEQEENTEFVQMLKDTEN